MKALTLTQPWATLVAIGAKRIETRGWNTAYRGFVAIHAAKGFPAEAEALCHTEPFRSVLNGAGIQRSDELPRGVVVATATLDVTWRFTPATEGEVRARSGRGLLPPHEAAFGDYAAGRSGLLFARVLPLIKPVPARGMLSLWEVPPDVLAAISAQFDDVRAL